MTTLMDFLTSKEVFIVIVIAVSVCIVGTIYFVIEKLYKNHKEKNESKLFNTTANKIIKIVDNQVVVEPVVKEVETKPVAEPSVIKKTVEKKVEPVVNIEKENSQKIDKKIMEEPIIINNAPVVEEPKKEEKLVIPVEEVKKDERLVIPIEEYQQKVEKKEENSSVENILKEVSQEVEKNHIDKIEYTAIEPNPEEAKEEIRKATEELLKTQELQLKEEIDLAKFEEEQEENAIISLDELYEKSKTLYDQNEITQYEDEGNEPISIADLEKRMNKIKEEVVEIEKEEVIEPVVEIKKEEHIKLDDFNTIDVKDAYKDDKIFKSSPIISPIFGIEKQTNDMEFENTANYDKFDDEIKKTNEFLKVLKELKKKLE